MLNYIPSEISIASFSLIGVLTGYIWNNQSKRISKIENIQTARPCNSIHLKIIEMQTDIRWIKNRINNNKK